MLQLRNYLFLILLVSGGVFGQGLEIDLFATGLNNPVALQHAGDDRMFAVEKGGTIRIINANGSVISTPFLNVTSMVTDQNEQGLLGLAFHPDYSNNGYFYVYYTDLQGDSQLDRYTVSGNPNLADPTSRLNLLSITQPGTIHNGGCINFGPDGYLYIATGDGQGGGDPNMNAQNTSLLLGKILRLDVDNPGGANNYGIPADNPFAGVPGNAEEIWAYGLRNPWKFSFDAVTGDLWLGDVGNNRFEEVNMISSTTAGANFGWRCYEGFEEFITTNCDPPGTMTFPVFVYEHVMSNCNAITAGYVYRGTDYPQMQGLFFFADYCRTYIWSLNENFELRNYGQFFEPFVSFGENSENELFIVSKDGQVYRLNGEMLGIDEAAAPNDITILPNPASESFVIKSNKELLSELSVKDLSGKTVLTYSNLNPSEQQIDISELASGIYLVNIKTAAGGNHIEKLVVH